MAPCYNDALRIMIYDAVLVRAIMKFVPTRDTVDMVESGEGFIGGFIEIVTLDRQEQYMYTI
jgi:hypothetical protein